jgi:hypothetical protein
MRGGLKVSKVSDQTNPTVEKPTTSRVAWLDQFAQSLEKASNMTSLVEATRSRNEMNIFDQITSIVSRNPIANSVEEVVQAYQKQCGLHEWLKQSEVESDIKVIAQEAAPEVSSKQPDNKFFGKFDINMVEDIKNFIVNKIKARHGNIQVPAVIHEVLQIFKNRGLDASDINDPDFQKFVNDQIIEVKKMNPGVMTNNSNLGKIEQDFVGSGAESDMFENLQPVKI